MPASSLRSGMTTIGALFSVTVAAGLLGLALEFALMQHVQDQLQAGTNAAALAGAMELIDEDVLYPGRLALLGPSAAADDVAAAEQAALQYGQVNVAGGVRMFADVANKQPAPLAFGWLAEPLDLDSPLEPWPQAGRANTLVVHAERSERWGNALPLWIGPLLGVAQADVQATAAACVDQRVHGFRPVQGSVIPVVPLAALGWGSNDAWTEQAAAPVQAGVNDRYTVNYSSGQVTAGADGIPEIVLCTPQYSAGQQVLAGNLGCLRLNAMTTAQDFARQLQEGLRPADLAELGGQLAVPPGGTLTLSGAGEFEALLPSLAGNVLGLRRAWPLYLSRQSSGSGGEEFELAGFAAGSVVDAYVDNGRSCLVVQPAVLVSRTALVHATAGWNPWLGRLCLVR
jgi:hypothetical protein